MSDELSDKQKDEIRKEKEKRVAHCQHKLDIFRQKVKQWDSEVMNKKSENGQRMWREGLLHMSPYEQKVQDEINRLTGISEEDWKDVHDHFEKVMDDFIDVYNQAVSKIRYDHPGDTFATQVFKQRIP